MVQFTSKHTTKQYEKRAVTAYILVESTSHAVAHLGFPAPGGQTQFWCSHPAVHGNIDVKNECGIKRRSKLNRALRSKTSCDCDVTYRRIIGYRRVKNPIIVSREAIPSPIWSFQTVLLLHSKLQ